MMVGSLLLSISICCLFLFARNEAAPTVIADYRIQDPNLTPALGRGYSLQANQVVSTCLNFSTKTRPTYNYDYDYLEIDSEGRVDEKKSGKFGGSLSWGFIKASVDASFTSSSNSTTKSKSIVTRMAMERYYSSVDDTTAVLTSDAMDLLRKGDIVGYYQACGSGYIRSIRRVAEVSAVFTFESKQLHSVMAAAANLKVSLFGRASGSGGFSMDSGSYSSDTSMKIQIKAFGLGLNRNGSVSLVATSLEDYRKAMDFAFKSMLDADVGMIKGVEIVPWIDCLQFQNAIDFSKEIEKLPKPGENRTTAEVEDPSKPPVFQMISSVEVKAISTINAEFITSMEAIYRQQMYYVATMSRCVGELELMKRRYPGAYLMDHTRMEFGEQKRFYTVDDVASVINLDQLRKKYAATQGFVQYFYGPCASALTKTSNNGRMTRYFWEFPNECDPKCVLANNEPDYQMSEDGRTLKSFSCRQTNKTLSVQDHHGIVIPRQTLLDIFTIDNLIDKFCMPELDNAFQNIIHGANLTKHL